ncbi:hypothetical protein [Limnoraphis robusta]|uniref:Uncharacterized protein n=1 Tax=Limnoraphis robusta CS-951 TaxID=1637645 RepID=A0A0F5YAB4_9CYAN|nr:hypothetical protein [Limnoraphis robusta]KKD35844.1 hypothetical protein WN50_23045 [Limnoraphis robusta CS-951]
MLINDLSYCEVVEENVVGGAGFVFKNVNLNTSIDQDFDFNADIDADKKINSDVVSKVKVEGNSAFVLGEATAFGNNTFTQIEGSTTTTDGLSESTLFAVSITG